MYPQPLARTAILLVLSFGAAYAGAQPVENPPDLAVNPASAKPDIREGLPTLFIAGDSTAARGRGEHQQGWAEPFADYFDPDKVTVVNRARGGRSSRTFITEGLWQELIDDVKAGDIVLIQFGHNDGGAINEEPPGSTRPVRARGTLPGLGEESVDIVNVLSGEPETVFTFGHYIRQMIQETRDRGAQPVLLSLTARNLWNEGRLERGSGQYGGWAYQLALDTNVPFIDVTNGVVDEMERMGKEAVDAIFEQDYVHFNLVGADLHARHIVACLKGLRLPGFDEFLSEKGAEVPEDDLARLRLPIPANPDLPSIFLIGDSTVRNGLGEGSNGQWGWGYFLRAQFDPERINVVNRAVGGLSSRTYLTNGHWQRVRSMIKPGDFVIMQFGHNDSSPVNDNSRARGTLAGTGNDAEDILNELTGEPETVHSYGWYLRHFISEARTAGAIPLVCSPIPRKQWDDDGRTLLEPVGKYRDWAMTVALNADAAFIDLQTIIARRYNAVGPHMVELFFGDERTHTSAAGAVLNAEAVAEGVKALADHPLRAFLLE